MNARRPKPTAVKERTSPKPVLGLSRLFASANELVESELPAARVQDQDEVGHALKVSTKHRQAQVALVDQSDDRTMKIEELALRDATAERTRARLDEQDYGTAVRVTPSPKKQKVLDLDKTKTLIRPEQSAVLKDPIKSSPSSKPAKSAPQTNKIALILLVSAGALIAYGLGSALSSSSSSVPHERKSALSQTEINERLKYYQTTLGQRLNRERIGVEIENFNQAPSLSGADHKVKPPSMLEGLPLEGEANHFQRPKDSPADPTYSEAKTGYGLQEEQERRRFEAEAEKQWVAEFVENARRDGYDVQIDPNGRVRARKLSDDEREPSSVGLGGGAQ